MGLKFSPFPAIVTGVLWPGRSLAHQISFARRSRNPCAAHQYDQSRLWFESENHVSGRGYQRLSQAVARADTAQRWLPRVRCSCSLLRLELRWQVNRGTVQAGRLDLDALGGLYCRRRLHRSVCRLSGGRIRPIFGPEHICSAKPDHQQQPSHSQF